MEKIKSYIKLMRIHHYIKNLIIFIPLLFSGRLLNINDMLTCLCGVVSFSLLSSAVYCLNDVKDVEKDKRHIIKKNRPVAAGKISKTSALIFMTVLIVFSITICSIITIYNNLGYISIILWFSYLVLNIGYSCRIKRNSNSRCSYFNVRFYN